MDRIKRLHTQNTKSIGCMQRKVVEVLHVRHMARYMQELTIKPLLYISISVGGLRVALEYLS